MTRKPAKSALPVLNAEIIEESEKWVRANKGTKICDGEYKSPRVSSEIADCSMLLTFDQFSYCSLGCLYCFAYFFKSNNPVIKGDISLKAIDVDKKILAFKGKSKSKDDMVYYNHFYKRKFLLHWGGLADPFCRFERRNGTGLKMIDALGEMNYPCLFSFKGNTVLKSDYMQIWKKYSDQQNFAFQISMVTGSDEMAKRIEIGVPSPTKRLQAIKELSDMGYWTILRLRPFIIGITDDGLDELLGRALEAGIKAISAEFFAMDSRSNAGMKSRYKWIAELIGIKDLHSYFKNLSPSQRGGYMRLNRLVKEPYVKKIYTFCRDNGLVCGISDPDYKELNTTGSCCGMPKEFPDNPLLENWTRSQLTYHLKEARRRHHKTGKKQRLYFGKVYGDESYLDEPALANDHVGVIGHCLATRSNLTQRLLLQQQWNNLRSPANPRNYLDGKVLPTGLDDDGNLVFTYVPSEYEQRWKEEGIKL